MIAAPKSSASVTAAVRRDRREKLSVGTASNSIDDHVVRPGLASIARGSFRGHRLALQRWPLGLQQHVLTEIGRTAGDQRE